MGGPGLIDVTVICIYSSSASRDIVSINTYLNSEAQLFKIFGDSHVDLFGLVGADAWINHTGLAVTLNRLDSTELWGLEPWLDAARGLTVVVSVGHTDVRAHWWRRSVIAGCVLEYVDQEAQKFVQWSRDLIERFQLEALVIYGPPPFSRHGSDGQWPFSGTPQTRNRMVDLWNRSVIDHIQSQPQIKFATAFYRYLDPALWLAEDGAMDSDGLHFAPALRFDLVDNIVLPAVQGSQTVIAPHIDRALAIEGRIQASAWREHGPVHWDSWIFSEGRDQPSETYARRSTDLANRDYDILGQVARPSRRLGPIRYQYVFWDEFSRYDFLPYKELELV